MEIPTMRNKSWYLAGLLGLAMVGAFALAADEAPTSNVPKDYKGTVFTDEKMKETQKIPGKVFCAYYDKGGEGVAYHDNTKNNDGSNGLNKGNKTYVGMFRRDEAVDISYTKNGPDTWEGQKVTPDMDLLYVGWTEAKEWFNLTVEVKEAGTYTADLMYTSNQGGAISFDLNGKAVGDPVKIETTNDPKDTTDWRQWHHWNIAKDVLEVKLEKGLSVITFHVVEKGQMNFMYLDFQPKKADAKKDEKK
jgi:hypothetical protein